MLLTLIKKLSVNELKILCNLRPCIVQDVLLRVDGRLENADLPIGNNHTTINTSR